MNDNVVNFNDYIIHEGYEMVNFDLLVMNTADNVMDTLRNLTEDEFEFDNPSDDLTFLEAHVHNAVFDSLQEGLIKSRGDGGSAT